MGSDARATTLSQRSRTVSALSIPSPIRDLTAVVAVLLDIDGGEEFCVLLPGLSKDLALAVAERIRASFNRCAIEGVDLTLSASFGVAAWHPRQTVDELLSNADKALYRAKDEGRNRVALAP